MPKAAIPTRALRFTPVAIAAFLACTALAGPGDVEAPPQPNSKLGLVGPVIGYAVMALATAGLIGISLMQSRRGAQD